MGKGLRVSLRVRAIMWALFFPSHRSLWNFCRSSTLRLSHHKLSQASPWPHRLPTPLGSRNKSYHPLMWPRCLEQCWVHKCLINICWVNILHEHFLHVSHCAKSFMTIISFYFHRNLARLSTNIVFQLKTLRLRDVEQIIQNPATWCNRKLDLDPSSHV